jgi:hypothetical protein
MASAPYERLSAQDRSFFVFEDASAHMHLGGIAVFEAGPLATAAGGVDVERIRAYIAARLHLVPRYRQRLAWVPVLGRPVWVDDAHFNLSYHVRHTAVPRPGDAPQLKRLAARILSQQLDRGKPLWEIWITEGLDGDRFAMLVKTHHALADGVSAFNLFSALLSPAPEEAVAPPAAWSPRPAPSPWALLRDQLVFQTTAPLRLGLDLARALREPRRLRDRVAESVQAVWELVGAGLRLPQPTPLNRPIGPHRRFDWLTLDLAEVKVVKNALGGTVNDVVSVRAEDERGVVNNRASAWLMELPVSEPDPCRRLALVQAATAQRKASRQELGPDVLGRAVEYAIPGVLTLGVRLASRLHPYNLIVTNVPGPQVPLYLLGARLIEGYPQVPLFENQGLGVALFSYCGMLCWGFNADWDLVPDLPRFVEAVAASFDELRCAAGAAGGGVRAARTEEPALAGRVVSGRLA